MRENRCNSVTSSHFADLVETFPRSCWKEMADQALETIQLMDKHDILSRDVRLCNFLVSQRPEEAILLYMKDFGLCRFRISGEAEQDWCYQKWWTGEEVEFLHKLKELFRADGFAYEYPLSDK